MNICLWDIETAPRTDAANFRPFVKTDGRLTDPKKIEADVDNKLLKAGLDPYMSRIVAVGYAGMDMSPYALSCKDADEEKYAIELLFDTWEELHMVPCGYNSRGYDHHVLNARARLLGVSIPKRFKHINRYFRHGDDILDLCDITDDPCEHVVRRSLESMCAVHGIDLPGDDIKGSEIAQAVADGRWEDIVRHVVLDVIRTRELAKRLGVV